MCSTGSAGGLVGQHLDRNPRLTDPKKILMPLHCFGFGGFRFRVSLWLMHGMLIVFLFFLRLLFMPLGHEAFFWPVELGVISQGLS